tara:strand:+ start:542 stop:2554 length:2013 start_codon:yes stop_codon:yes gene_type:complete
MADEFDRYIRKAPVEDDEFAQYARSGSDTPAKRLMDGIEAKKPKTLKGFGENLATSAGKFASGIGEVVAHPLNTAANIATAVAGTSPVSGPPGSWQHDVASPTAAAVGDFYKKRYGGAQNIVDTAYEDPIGVAADASALLGTGSVGLRAGSKVAEVANAAKTATTLGNAATALRKAEQWSNPASLMGKGIGAVARKAGNKLTSIESGLNPVQGAAVDYALSDPKLRNVVDLGDATGNGFIESAKAVLEKNPLSSGPMGKAALATQEAIQSKMADIADAVAPGGAREKLTAGTGLLSKVAGKTTEYAKSAKASYEDLFDRAGKNPVRVQVGEETVPGPPTMYGGPKPVTRPVYEMVAGPTSTAEAKAAAGPMLEELEKTIPEAQRQMSPTVSLLRQIMNRPDTVSLETAMADNSALQNIARTEAPALRTQAQRVASKLSAPYRAAIDAAADAIGPEAKAALESGRESTVQKYDLGKALPRSAKDRPVDMANLLVAGGDKSFPILEKISKHTPDAVPDVARATIEQIFRHSTENGGVSRIDSAVNRWNAMGPQTKTLLFGADVSDEITNLMQYAKLAGKNANPSGTAKVGAVTGMAYLLLHDPVTAIAAMTGSRLLAKGILSPEVAATARQTGRIPAPQVPTALKVAASPLKATSLNRARAIGGDDPLELYK